MMRFVQTKPYMLNNEEGQFLQSLGTLVSIKATSEQTGCVFNLFEVSCLPGFATQLHIHYIKDVAIYVLEGTLIFFWGTDKKEAVAGSFLSVLTPYRAIAASTGYFQAAVAENEAFENNMAEVQNANVDLGELPLTVISRGYWDPIPGFTDSENQEAWRKWQEMQSKLLSLSSNSKQILPTGSEHNIRLQQPQLVINAIYGLVKAD